MLKRDRSEEVVRRNMEDLSQEVLFVKVGEGIYVSRNPFYDVLVNDVLIHCMRHCVKGGCVIYKVSYDRVEHCERVNLKERFKVKEVIKVAKSPISINAMREVKGLEEAVRRIVKRMNEGLPECLG
ncbi:MULTISPECIES: hypothetical protein [Metallosphaera]|uniref:Uncharacterized protein n=1 Tax=Metallosphaera cuprina (strain Ar-4) TaxID=1006006 RepID=F4G340_METCR|nr:hypothetical protein [Metallosphaera cuprina]AEB95238.1 conserved hypothetical protein [Metallosphaera cuprina Ar-4]